MSYNTFGSNISKNSELPILYAQT